MKKNKNLSDQHRKNGFEPKPNNDKRTRIVAWVLILLIGFCTVCSFLTLGLTFKDCVQAKADDANTSTDIDYSVIDYPVVNVPYSPGVTGDYILQGIKFSYDKNVNAIVLSGTLNNSGSNRYYWDFTDFFNYIPGSTYSCYIYSSCNAQDIRVYSNQVSLSNDLFVNKFFKFTGRDMAIKFGLSFPGVYTENYFNGYYTFMCWQGDWELNSEIINSLSYQIGYNEGKIYGYQNGYDIGSKDGYDKGFKNAFDSFDSTYYLNKYFFTDSSNAVGKVYQVDKDNPQDTLLGSFNLGVSSDSGLTFVNATQLYTDYTPARYNYVSLFTVDDSFTYGYNQLVFNGLPLGTCVLLRIATKNSGTVSYAEVIYAVKGDGSLFLVSGYMNGYIPNGYLYEVQIRGFIVYDFATGTSYAPKDGKFFNFKDYANFSVTLPKDFSNKLSYQEGYNKAKDYYYNLWYLNRYEQGRQAGVDAAGKYTWLGLFGSIVDAPITVLRGLLNFDLLGFNMFNAFSALVTLAIIIAIIRMVL